MYIYSIDLERRVSVVYRNHVPIIHVIKVKEVIYVYKFCIDNLYLCMWVILFSIKISYFLFLIKIFGLFFWKFWNAAEQNGTERVPRNAFHGFPSPFQGLFVPVPFRSGTKFSIFVPVPNGTRSKAKNSFRPEKTSLQHSVSGRKSVKNNIMKGSHSKVISKALDLSDH